MEKITLLQTFFAPKWIQFVKKSLLKSSSCWGRIGFRMKKFLRRCKLHHTDLSTSGYWFKILYRDLYYKQLKIQLLTIMKYIINDYEIHYKRIWNTLLKSRNQFINDREISHRQLWNILLTMVKYIIVKSIINDYEIH